MRSNVVFDETSYPYGEKKEEELPVVHPPVCLEVHDEDLQTEMMLDRGSSESVPASVEEQAPADVVEPRTEPVVGTLFIMYVAIFGSFWIVVLSDSLLNHKF
ncbi:hypothetical protein DY000_02006010 [Brassica cretica]|uniref:Uncharacterized protein n=1 Tax=Brassica cretica TaxID=69181 RepID=A0ABQ7C0S2_BRACR|nr:hypothetical protein DY000_02006010 [Brassica cretica]